MKPFHGLIVGGLLLAALTAATAAQAAGPPVISPARQDATAGAAVFQANCAACHQSDGAGIPGAFPPLAGNPNATDADYVISVITNGRSGEISVLGATYNSVMPAVTLSAAELADVVAYVQRIAAATEPTATTAAPGSTTGDAARGESLFTGSAALENGGPACRACHSAGEVDFKGGSGLGPDLSDVHTRFGGDAGVASWLAAPATPTMQAVFANEPLTDGEIADVTAFLAQATTQQAAQRIDQILMGGGIGLLVLFGLMAVVVRRPKESYNQRLRRKQ